MLAGVVVRGGGRAVDVQIEKRRSTDRELPSVRLAYDRAVGEKGQREPHSQIFNYHYHTFLPTHLFEPIL